MKIKNRLTVAFVMVVLVATVIIILIANISVKVLFEDFVLQYRTARLGQWANLLETYYQQEESWDQLKEDLFRGSHPRRGMSGKFPAGERLIVADYDGYVVLDTHNSLEGEVLSKSFQAGGLPLLLDDKNVGIVFLNPSPSPGVTTLLEEEFSRSVTRAVFFGGAMAVLVALVLSLLFAQKISSPLDKLTGVLKEFTGGNHKVRAEVKDSEDEIGQLGEAFNNMAETIEKQEELRKNLTADVAHELRTPLSILRGNIESLQAGVVKPDMEVISSLHDEIIRISRIVKELQDLSLAEAGRLSLNYSKIKIKDLVNRVIQTFQPELEARKIDLKKKMPEEISYLWVDGDRINQVMINLLGNALKYTPEGGEISVTGQVKGEELLISISDTGPGIKKEDLPFIFERFYRSPQERYASEGGSGLGLAIAKGLVEAHGGIIWAEGNSLQGTTFTFTIPLNNN